MEVSKWRELVSNALEHLSSKDYQENSWKGHGNRISSFDEIYCEIFDDVMLEEFLTSDEVGIDNKAKEEGVLLLRKLDDYAAKIKNEHNIDHILVDPEWDDIRSAASGLLNRLFAN